MFLTCHGKIMHRGGYVLFFFFKPENTVFRFQEREKVKLPQSATAKINQMHKALQVQTTILSPSVISGQICRPKGRTKCVILKINLEL